MNDTNIEKNTKSKPKNTLWTTPGRSCFFIIDEGHNFPPGDFLLCTFSGRQIQVDPTDLVPYEVSEEEANEFLAGQLREVLMEMKERLLSGSGRPRPSKAADPADKIFQADLMDGAAGFIARVSEGLVAQMQDKAEALRQEAAHAVEIPVGGPHSEVKVTDPYESPADMVARRNGYHLDGVDPTEDNSNG